MRRGRRFRILLVYTLFLEKMLNFENERGVPLCFVLPDFCEIDISGPFRENAGIA